MKKLLFSIITFLICLISFAFYAFPTFAQSNRGLITVEPAFTEAVLEKADQQKEIELFYTNHTSQSILLELFPLDFKQQDDTGAISFLGKDAGSFSYSLSSFIELPENTIELNSGETKKVQITVKNRQDLSPGGHYAAIIARQLKDQTTDTITTISPSLSTFILMRKTGGERFNLSLKRLNWPEFPVVFHYPSSVHLLFQNEGNIHLTPYGRVEIHDIFGRELFKGVINTSSLRVFPSARRYIPTELKVIKKSLPISIDTIAVKGSDSLRKVSYSYHETFFYIDITGIVIVAVCVSALSITIMKLRRKHEKED